MRMRLTGFLVGTMMATSAAGQSCSSTSTNESSSSGGNGGAGAGGNDASTGGIAGSGGSAGTSADSAAETKTTCFGAADLPSCDGADAAPDGSDACPTQNDPLTYLCVNPANGDAELFNGLDGRTYWCSIESDAPNDEYDCTTAPKAGEKFVIGSLGNAGPPCSCNAVVLIGSPKCTYSCRLTD